LKLTLENLLSSPLNPWFILPPLFNSLWSH